MHIEESGKGSAIVLIHGCPTAVDVFDGVVDRLKGSYRCLVPHLPGYGKSAPPKNPYPLAEVQRELEDGLLERGVEQASFVGFSGGGYLALSVALEGRVRADLVYCLAGHGGLDAADRGLMGAFVSMLSGDAPLTPELRAVFAARMLSPEFLKANPGSTRTIDRFADAVSKRVLASELAAVATAPDLHPRLGRLEASLVARVGALDVATPPQYSRRLADGARKGTFEEVPNAGHALLLEDFEGTFKSLEAALSNRV